MEFDVVSFPHCVEKKSGSKWSFNLKDRQKITIGRRPESDISLTHVSVSGIHCTLECRIERMKEDVRPGETRPLSQSGQVIKTLWLTDHSTNGTFLEGDRVKKGIKCIVGMDDTIVLGKPQIDETTGAQMDVFSFKFQRKPEQREPENSTFTELANNHNNAVEKIPGQIDAFSTTTNRQLVPLELQSDGGGSSARFAAMISRLKEENNVVRREKDSLTDELNRTLVELDESERLKQMIQQEAATLKEEVLILREAGGTTEKKWKSEKLELQDELKSCKEKESSLEIEISKLRKELEESTENHAIEISGNQEAVKAANFQIKRLEEEVAELQRQMKELETQRSRTRAKYDTLKARNECLESDHMKIRSEKFNLETDLASTTARCGHLEEKLCSMSSNLEFQLKKWMKFLQLEAPEEKNTLCGTPTSQVGSQRPDGMVELRTSQLNNLEYTEGQHGDTEENDDEEEVRLPTSLPCTPPSEGDFGGDTPLAGPTTASGEGQEPLPSQESEVDGKSNSQGLTRQEPEIFSEPFLSPDRGKRKRKFQSQDDEAWKNRRLSNLDMPLSQPYSDANKEKKGNTSDEDWFEWKARSETGCELFGDERENLL